MMMKSLALVLPLLTASLASQAGIEVTLKAASEVVMATAKTAELVLTCTVTQKTDVPLTLLSGMKIKTTVNGQPGPSLIEDVSGTVSLSPGTKIERRISVELSRVAPVTDPEGMTRISFEWVGNEAAAVVSIVPDLTQVKMSQFDLTHTKVQLVTNYGDMLIKFYPDKAPKHVANFIKLAKDGFYDGTRFHRVIPGFMIQGGCPNTKEGATGTPGTGSPGYTVEAEFNDTRHVKGVLSMARSSDPNSAGCQFFIVHAPAQHLDGQYTAFGELVTGMDTLDKIAAVAVGGAQGSTPLEPVHVKAAIVQPVFNK